MIHELKNQGLGISENAQQNGLDRKTVRKHLRGGLQFARFWPRQPRPRMLNPFECRFETPPGKQAQLYLIQRTEVVHFLRPPNLAT